MTFTPSAVIISPKYRQPLNALPSAAMAFIVGKKIVLSASAFSSSVKYGLGATAPIPPVFSPASPSPMRLWSMLETMGTTHFPSVNASTLTSGPVKNSSMTTFSPEAPNLPRIISATAVLASSRLMAMMTPFPSASPSALTTTGTGEASIYAFASFSDVNTAYFAVGIEYFFIRSFAKALLDSISAAAFSGPKHFIPSACSLSTAPIASGSSGATTTKSIRFSFANAVIASMSVALIGTHSASRAIPPFPGRTYIFSTRALSLSFLTMACSLPPPPTTATFIQPPGSMMEQSQPRKAHRNAEAVGGLDDLIVPDGAAGFGYVTDAALVRAFHVVAEREKRV